MVSNPVKTVTLWHQPVKTVTLWHQPIKTVTLRHQPVKTVTLCTSLYEYKRIMSSDTVDWKYSANLYSNNCGRIAPKSYSKGCENRAPIPIIKAVGV